MMRCSWLWLRWLGLLLGVGGLAACQFGKSALLPETGQQRGAIVNGELTQAFPAVGTLTRKQASFCTGTLIAPRLVLTAAHCIDSSSFKSQPTAFRIDLPLDWQRFRSIYAEVDSAASKTHPAYKKTENPNGSLSEMQNDIALVVLKTPIFGVPVVPVNTATVDKSWLDKDAWVMGYGRISFLNVIPALRKYATTMKLSQLSAQIGGKDVPNTIRLTSDTSSTCQGDSGGPFLIERDGTFFVFAVNSFGRIGCNGSAGAFRTDPYIPWINTFLARLNACQNDAWCGPCAQCSSETCTPKKASLPSESCTPCRKDEDCKQGRCILVGTGKRCLSPCDKGCCPSQYACNDQSGDGLCYPTRGTCPPSSCQSDDDCSNIEQCKSGICIPKPPPRHKALCMPCKSHEECGKGNYCQSAAGLAGRCLQACSPDEQCPEGFRCKALGPGFQQCIPKDGRCTLPCTKDDECPTPLTCQSNACLHPKGGQKGQICSKTQPCADGLQCIQSADTSRCFQACGVPPGSAGAACRSSLTPCDPGLLCVDSPLGARMCIAPCSSNTPCKQGGFCMPFINYCLCQEDKDCTQGNQCNYVAEGFGACASGTSRPCPADATCRRGALENACIPKDAQERALGQPCDIFHPCRKGLRCMPGINVCVEDCSESEICQHGGACRKYLFFKNKMCLCNAENTCPDGTTCRTFAQLLNQPFSLCVPNPGAPCSADLQCPASFVCHNKQCILPSQLPEPTPEPQHETTSHDAGPPETIPTNKACGCQHNPAQPTPPLLTLLTLAFLCLTRRQPRQP